jgi:hypothetical protein
MEPMMTDHLAARLDRPGAQGEPSAGVTGSPTGGQEPTAGLRVLLPGTRVILVAFVVLTAVATYELFFQSARTQSGFAWTILPPVTAAFLGAGYGAGCVLTILTLRTRTWADARLTVTTVFVFVVVTLAATLLHLGKFHFHVAGVIPRFAAWFWLGIYLTVPVALAVAIIVQSRRRGTDPPRGRPLPVWLAVPLAAQGAVMLAAGIALFAGPGSAATLWPWKLTPLTARAVAAWLIAFGAAAALALLDRDLRRLRAAAAGYAVFGLLALVAVARFAGQVHWGSAAAVVYLIVVGSVLITGSAGWLLAARPALRRRNEP